MEGFRSGRLVSFPPPTAPRYGFPFGGYVGRRGAEREAGAAAGAWLVWHTYILLNTAKGFAVTGSRDGDSMSDVLRA